MIKWGRNYQLSVQTPTGVVTIEPPLTVEFDVNRASLASASYASFRVYNLSALNRNLLRKNQNDIGDYRKVQFLGGYGTGLAQAFTGNASYLGSYREGNNFITEIQCFGGGTAFNTGTTNTTFPAKTPIPDVIKGIMAKGLPNVTPGVVGNYPGVLGRGASFSGNTVDLLRELTGGGFFIDNERAHALQDEEYIASYVGFPVISSDSGLLGTPKLDVFKVRLDMIFEPRLQVGQRVTLQSKTDANFNGAYKCTAVHHKGMISEAVCGAVTTSVEMVGFKELVGRV